MKIKKLENCGIITSGGVWIRGDHPEFPKEVYTYNEVVNMANNMFKKTKVVPEHKYIALADKLKEINEISHTK